MILFLNRATKITGGDYEIAVTTGYLTCSRTPFGGLEFGVSALVSTEICTALLEFWEKICWADMEDGGQPNPGTRANGTPCTLCFIWEIVKSRAADTDGMILRCVLSCV